MKHLKKFNESERQLPSTHQIKDIVTLDFGISGKIENCRVEEIHFEEDKVYYDVEVLVDNENATRLYHVDSVIIK